MRTLLVLTAVCTVAALPRQDDVERHLRAGDAAAARGDWAAAAGWYERAEPLTLEPGLVAFNLATARYHLAKAGHLRELPAAEAGYRACLTGGRRARALFGLGNCLMLRAGSGGSLDPAMLRAAADRFLECRLADPALAADARFNEQRARLLLLQVASPGEAGDDPGGGEDQPDTPPPPKDDKRPGQAEGSAGTERVPVKDAGEGPTVEDKDGPPRAGKGKLTPVPAAGDAAPLDVASAGLQVQEAARRILDEWRAHRRQRVKPREGARDW